MLSVLQFRLNRRYVEAQPPFIAIELDQSDSGREGCAVSTLTITSEPKDWRGAIQVLRALRTAAHSLLTDKQELCPDPTSGALHVHIWCCAFM